jgi:murein DD-endopeptidase MepM/ murein hydrolase activator NlpD
MNLKMPIKVTYIISLRFKEKYDNWLANLLKHEEHDGIDFACPAGTKVYSTNISGEWVCRIGQDLDGQYYVITYVLTENLQVFFLLYRHLQNVKVNIGDFINDFEIGEVALNHLHFGVYGAVDPGRYLNN